MPAKIDIDAAPTRFGTGYPAPYDAVCAGRRRWKLGDAAGLTQFGVNLLRLPPGQWSSQRHWHTAEDEFVYVLEGQVVLVTDAGEEVLRPGDCVGFKAGDPNGHHLQNRSGGDDGADYPDIDLMLQAGASRYSHKDGTPYPEGPRRSR